MADDRTHYMYIQSSGRGMSQTASPHTKDAGSTPYVFKEEEKEDPALKKKIKKTEKWLLKMRSFNR